LDLKDYFFTIPLHPKDQERFVFSVPTNNNATPCAQYQWTVLPQVMKNSPTLCQIYVSQALQPFLGLSPLSIIHYMDDILLSHPDATQLTHLFPQVINRLNKFGLQVANEKIQSQYPFQFLGGTLLPGGLTMRPPKLTIKDKMTLNELHKLLGAINWLRQGLGIPSAQLQPLFDLLRGSTELNSLQVVTPQACYSFNLVQKTMQDILLKQYDPKVALWGVTFPTPRLPAGVLWQPHNGILE
jgi:hypothetical protein